VRADLVIEAGAAVALGIVRTEQDNVASVFVLSETCDLAALAGRAGVVAERVVAGEHFELAGRRD
jgi:hypothetical protein